MTAMFPVGRDRRRNEPYAHGDHEDNPEAVSAEILTALGEIAR